MFSNKIEKGVWLKGMLLVDFNSKLLAGRFNLDNQKNREQVRLKKYELGSPVFTSKNKVKILIFGNSHGRDFFNMFALNKELFSKYEFSMMDGQF